jgi:hypothetical protein
MKTLITAVALTLTTFASFAQEVTRAPEIENFVSTRTRAEVQAELKIAMAAGNLHAQGEITRAPEIEAFIAARTRAQVKDELMAALARGERLSQGEITRAPELERFVSTRTRAEVRNEVLAAMGQGERLSYGQASVDRVGERSFSPQRGVTTVKASAETNP